MRIRRVDVHAVRYRHAAGPFVMSGGRVSTGQEGALVRVETDGGLVGWGESCAIAPDYAQGHAPATRAALELLARSLLGADPRQLDVCFTRLEAAAKGYPEAKSALDTACWDLCGRATGLRVADLLGGAFQEEFPLYTGVGLAPPEEMRDRCAEAVAAGYRSVQLKLGTTAREDVERIEACLPALADADTVLLDANAFWPVADAVRVVAAVEGRDVHVEQPCATLEECAHVRRGSRRPFVLDESLASVADLVRARAAGAIDAARLKLQRFGGITPVRRARDLAVAFGLPMTIEDAGGGDVVSAALAHLTCSIPPKLLLGGYLPSEMTVERVARGTPAALGGVARLPDGPGLGIEVDEAALGAPVARIE
jgi:L-alanine-DL-glutamate epimerase-like enolase superfamily enzyme